MKFSFRTIEMKLLVGRFLLGCICAVLVQCDSSESSTSVATPEVSVVDIVTEKLIKPSSDLTPEIKLPETTSSPNKNAKIISKSNAKESIEREIVVIRDQSGGGGHHDHGLNDHHGYHEHPHHHENGYHYDNDYHHPPPHHHHDHPHSPPSSSHHSHYPPPYPGYYPPHYPPYSHGMSQPFTGGAAIPPPYPYYPPPPYYNSPPRKPSTTIIQTTSDIAQNNRPKPTDLLNQGTEYLWNLFGKLGAVTSENHEVVLINPKSVPSAASVQMLTPSWYSNKVKIIPNVDCNNKE